MPRVVNVQGLGSYAPVKEDPVERSSPAPIQLDRLPVGVIVHAEYNAPPLGLGWTSGILDCSIDGSTCFQAYCLPFWLFSKTTTRARVGCCGFAGMLATYVFLSSGSFLSSRLASHEFVTSWELVQNNSDLLVAECSPLSFDSCLDSLNCAWVGTPGYAEEAGCEPAPTRHIDQATFVCGLGFLFTGMLLSVALLCLRANIRTRFRRKLGIQGSVLGDCAVHTFLPCCALAQEARQADSTGMPRVDCAGRLVEEPAPVMARSVV